MRSKVTGAVAESWGMPPGLVGAILGGAKPHQALKSFIKSETENLMWAAVGKALAEATGVPNAGDIFRQLKGMKDQKKAAKKAKQKQQLNTLVTVAAFTGGASLAAVAAMKAAEGAASGFAGGGLKGALVGAMGGVVGAAVSQFSGGIVEVGLSYDSQNGFGASASVGTPGAGPRIGVSKSEKGGTTVSLKLGMGKMGVGLSYNDKTKSTTFNAGAETASGTKIGFQAKHDPVNGYSGSVGVTGKAFTMGVNYSDRGGLSAYAGLAVKSKTDQYRSMGISYSKDEGAGAYIKQGSVERGQVGLSVSEKKGATAMFESDAFKMSYNQKEGFAASATIKTASGANLTLGYSKAGGLSSSMSVDTSKAKFKLAGSDEKGTYTGEENLIQSQDQLMARTDSVMREMQTKDLLDKKIKWLEANRKCNGKPCAPLNEAQRQYLMQNPEALSEAMHDVGVDAAIADKEGKRKDVARGDSRSIDGTEDSFFGSVMDGITGALTGRMSDRDGYVDENGAWVQRTCFVAGTLVPVHPATHGAQSINGQFFKQVEDIVAGDRVLSWNQERGTLEYSHVTMTFIRHTKEIYRLEYDDGIIVETTWSHPFFVEGRGWIQAKDLEVGDVNSTAGSILVGQGSLMPISMYGDESDQSSMAVPGPSLGLVAVRLLPRKATVYNFSVEATHTYFVSERMLLVHNGDYTSQFTKGYNMNRLATTVSLRYGISKEEALRRIKSENLSDTTIRFDDKAQAIYDELKAGRDPHEKGLVYRQTWDDQEYAVDSSYHKSAKKQTAKKKAPSKEASGATAGASKEGSKDDKPSLSRFEIVQLGAIAFKYSSWNPLNWFGEGDKPAETINPRPPVRERELVGSGRNGALAFVEGNKEAYFAGRERWSAGRKGENAYDNILTVKNDDGSYSRVYRKYSGSGLYTVAGIDRNISKSDYLSNGPGTTTCNVTASAFSIAYGGQSLIRPVPGGTEYGAGTIGRRLADGKYRGYTAASESEAERHARNGGLAVAVNMSNHIGVLTGGYDGEPKKGNLRIFQSGKDYGRMPLRKGFGSTTSQVKFFVYKGD